VVYPAAAGGDAHVVASVELREGARWTATLHPGTAELRDGLPVRTAFEPAAGALEDGTALRLPVFIVDEAAEAA
jgi:hypothetical protein